MSSETNKATMLRLWQVLSDEVWPTGNLAAANQFIAQPTFTTMLPLVR